MHMDAATNGCMRVKWKVGGLWLHLAFRWAHVQSTLLASLFPRVEFHAKAAIKYMFCWLLKLIEFVYYQDGFI
jgi:hypothetical protein